MNPKNSQDLFNKIRSQFTNIRLGDENGAATADPQDAVFFEFEFQEDSDTFGSVSVSIADGNTMKVFYNRNLVDKIDEDSKGEWYAFLKELKDFAVEHQLGFDVRDITKSNLSKQDYENLADTNKTVNTDEMSEELARITKLAGVEVKESLTGTAKRSYENLDKTKLIIRHSGKVDETVPGARSRQIQSLYIENEDGERFKYPMTHLAGARAMQRHVANGGRPHDEFGEHIVKTSEDIAKLNSFSRYVSNKDQLNDNAGDIIEKTKLKLENLRGYMKNIAKQSHYETASKDFKTSEEQILDDDTVAKLREKFTMTNLDKRVEDAFPLINRVMSELEAPKEEDAGNYVESYEWKCKKCGHTNTFGMTQKDVAEYIRSWEEDNPEIVASGEDTGEGALDWQMNVIKDQSGMHYGEPCANCGTIAESINELDDTEGPKIKDTQPTVLGKDVDPIKADPEPQVDHGAVVQSFLTDPDRKLILRKDASADKMLKATKFKDKSTMLGAILSDIASRMLTKTGEEDRVANFASRVADGIDQEGSASFKPGPDYNKNKKIAVQLAKRYIDDYKKMQSDPEYGKEVRMDPEEFNPKKHPKLDKRARGEAVDFEEWAESVSNEYAEPKHQDTEIAKKDKENATSKLDVTKADKMMNTTAYKRMQAGDPKYADKTNENQLEGLTFEDIKPYVSMYRDEKGKIVNDVLDKDGKSVFKTHDGKEAMRYLANNFDKLKKEDGESEAQPSVETQEEAEEINTELDRIKTLANLA